MKYIYGVQFVKDFVGIPGLLEVIGSASGVDIGYGLKPGKWVNRIGGRIICIKNGLMRN